MDANRCVGTCDLLLLTLDTLRYDVACRCGEGRCGTRREDQRDESETRHHSTHHEHRLTYGMDDHSRLRRDGPGA